LPLIKVTSATQQSLGSKENMCKYCSSNYLQHVAVCCVTVQRISFICWPIVVTDF